MKNIETFEQNQSKKKSNDRSSVDAYEPPKYAIEPAKGDKGFAFIKSMLGRVKKILEPGIWSTT
jgi:hypothetical protein